MYHGPIILKRMPENTDEADFLCNKITDALQSACFFAFFKLLHHCKMFYN